MKVIIICVVLFALTYNVNGVPADNVDDNDLMQLGKDLKNDNKDQLKDESETAPDAKLDDDDDDNELFEDLFASLTNERSCVNGGIRLVGGANSTLGRVEVCVNGNWGTVCDDYWGTADAKVVCRQLGYPTIGARAYRSAHFGQGTGRILFDNVACTGRENSLFSCRYTSRHNCRHSEDAGVSCQVTCINGAIRLVGGYSSSQGRVEVCANNEWGTVCDDYWGTADARVVCRQLGFSTFGARAYSRAHFGQGTGRILLDNVACTGRENSLFRCRYTSSHNCHHSEDAGVSCRQVETAPVAKVDDNDDGDDDDSEIEALFASVMDKNPMNGEDNAEWGKRLRKFLRRNRS
jgi:hypothetical protein